MHSADLHTVIEYIPDPRENGYHMVMNNTCIVKWK